MRSDWFGGLLYWRARTSHDTEADCDRNACANHDPVPNVRATLDSTAVRWIAFSEGDEKGMLEPANKTGG
jgi:hypothetical protein